MGAHHSRRVLIFGGNNPQIPYIKAARERKLEILLVDVNPDCPGKQLADSFINFSYEDCDAILRSDAAEKIKQAGFVFTASSQTSHLSAAKISDCLGLSYPPVNTIDSLINKARLDSMLKMNHVTAPPTTIISSPSELRLFLSDYSQDEKFYLKSDYSKNPTYIYIISARESLEANINWIRDERFRGNYVIQPEVSGISVRLNLLNQRAWAFDFNSGLPMRSSQITATIRGAKDRLTKFLDRYSLSAWIVKFDLIVDGDLWYVLDIGFDPPFRLKKLFEEYGVDFAGCYLDLYLNKIDRFMLLEKYEF